MGNKKRRSGRGHAPPTDESRQKANGRDDESSSVVGVCFQTLSQNNGKELCCNLEVETAPGRHSKAKKQKKADSSTSSGSRKSAKRQTRPKESACKSPVSNDSQKVLCLGQSVKGTPRRQNDSAKQSAVAKKPSKKKKQEYIVLAEMSDEDHPKESADATDLAKSAKAATKQKLKNAGYVSAMIRNLYTPRLSLQLRPSNTPTYNVLPYELPCQHGPLFREKEFCPLPDVPSLSPVSMSSRSCVHNCPSCSCLHSGSHNYSLMANEAVYREIYWKVTVHALVVLVSPELLNMGKLSYTFVRNKAFWSYDSLYALLTAVGEAVGFKVQEKQNVWNLSRKNDSDSVVCYEKIRLSENYPIYRLANGVGSRLDLILDFHNTDRIEKAPDSHLLDYDKAVVLWMNIH